MRARLVALLVAVSLLACRRETPQPPPPATQTATQPATGPRDGGRLVRRLQNDVATLNYVLHTLEEERQVLAYLYDPLIDLDQNLNPIPATVARWDVLDQGRAYVLHLDPRATFSDGQPVRASDVIFTLHKILDEESIQYASWFEHLDREKTAVIDERTVRVVFKEARPAQLRSFNIAPMPEHVYAKEKFDRTTKVVGNGPYVLKQRERGGRIVLERRKDYWREKPHIQTIVFRAIADDTVAWRAMQRGDIDVTLVGNDVWWKAKDDPKIKETMTFINIFQPSYNAIFWNLSDPLFSDVRVRRALAMAFDRDKIIEELYHGQARPVSGPFTPDQWAANPRVLPIELNTQGASALLSSAGWRDSDNDGVLDRNGKMFEFALLVPAGAKAIVDQAQVYQESLRAIGVIMNITTVDTSAYFEQMMKRNFQASFASWQNEPDPDPYAIFHSSQVPPDGLNVVGYASPEADALMEKARKEFDHTERVDLYQQLHEVIARDQPYLFMIQTGAKWAVNRRVQDVKTAPSLGLFLWYPGPRSWWVQ